MTIRTCIAFSLFAFLAAGISPAGDERPPAERISAKDRDYWFFQPLAEPAVPAVKDEAGWARNEIDAFILAKQAKHGISPAPRADARTLIRRAYFDLIGLPPGSKEIESFAKAHAADPDDAFEKLVDDLLKSPQYGERWGRHWLDLVRYGDSNGYKADEYRPHMWRYRDWVIKAINDDMPYDRFLRWQLAGDEIAPENPDAVTATGYLRLWPYESNQRDAPKQWNHILEDITDITGHALIGLSMGCAKCHDHKFDPILQDDYFRMQAFFTGIYPDDTVAATPAEKKAHAAELAKWEATTAAIQKEIDEILAQGRKNGRLAAVKFFTPELQAVYNKPVPECTPLELQHKLLIQRQVDISEAKAPTKLKDEPKKRYNELIAELKKHEATRPEALPPIYAIRDTGPEAPLARIFDAQEKQFPPGYLSILDTAPAKIEKPESPTVNSSGRRTTFANWLTRPDNQLSTRVMANRLWHYHFGAGIVPNANDFGKQGQLPTHPELLDWLARKFVAEGWSLKKMHKLLMTSAAWRQASLVEPSVAAAEKDPGNTLLWRQRIRRLGAEQIRDASLQAGGELDPKMGGEGVTGESSTRRAVYQRLMRNPRTLFLNTFDGPDGFGSCARRDVTTTAPQALVMLNNSFLNQRAATIAKKAAAAGQDDDAIEAAFAAVLGRKPSGEELSQAHDFLALMTAEAARATPSPAEKPEPKIKTTAFKAFPKTPYAGEHAVNIQPDSLYEKLEIQGLSRLEGDTFTFEAVVNLDSLYPDASVRTIAGRWNGNSGDFTASSHGWALGITSTKSAYQPNNLILQLVGSDTAQNPRYEVVASDIRIPRQTPYYVAAVIQSGNTKDGGTATFYARDLSKPDSKVETATVEHPFAGNLSLKERKLFLGGRDQTRHQFDGAIARFRLTDHALSADQLIVGKQPAGDSIAEGLFAEPTLSDQIVRTVPAAHSQPAKRTDPRLASLIDLSLALLNSNEFLYID